MLLILIAAAAAATSAPGRAIAEHCANREPCVTEQRTALRHFLGHMVMYEVPDAVGERCMRAGKRGRHIDWTAATPCLRNWAKGRKNTVEKALER